MTTPTSNVDYDTIVPKKIDKASQQAIRALIRWADYCYWVKDESIMKDNTFDMLVKEYSNRYPEDKEFLEQIGMW